MRYFLGMDVGWSKTHALLVDETGQCVGVGISGGGNYQGVGYDGLERALRESLEGVVKGSGVDTAYIAGAGFGIAGYDFPSDRDAHLQTIAKLGLSCSVEVVNDGWNGLFAGATRGVGVNVTAGSSNNCRGRNEFGKEGRIVGNGPAFGEYGGGYEITGRALQYVNYAWIKRTPPTTLTKVLLDATGAKDELDLMEGLSKEYYQLFPLIAVEVIRAAKAGDPAARGVLNWAGEELGWLAVSVARQIGMENDEVEVIQSGSVFEAGEIITSPMKAVVLQNCPKAILKRLDGAPVTGAVILGMETAGFDGYAVRDEMVKTAKEIIK